MNNIVVASLILLGIIILSLLGWQVKLGKDGIATEKVGKRKKSKTTSLNACRKSYEFGFRRGTEPSRILMQQMSIYDELEEELISDLQARFLETLKASLPACDPAIVHEEYTLCETLLLALFRDIKNMIRRWFKNNHYAIKNTQEQIEYIKKKKSVIYQFLSQKIDRWWIGSVVTKETFFSLFDENRGTYFDSIEIMFQTVFALARTGQEQRLASERAYCQFIEEAFGEKVEIVDESTII